MATKRKTPTTDTLHVVELRAENVKRLRAVTIRPTGELVIVGGRNEQGKTSTLDAIEMALGGKRAIPAVPLRKGARKGSILVDLGEYRIERTFTPDGTSLRVLDATGVPLRSPQAALDALYGSLSFDPLEFARMEPREQDATLKAALGLDFSDLERRRAKAYAERTELNRECKRLDARLASMPQPRAGLPDREVSVAELAERLTQAQSHSAELNSLARRAAQCEDTIRRLTEQLRAAQSELDELGKRRAKLSRVEVESQDALREQIATAEETNRGVRLEQERGRVEGELVAVEEQVSELNSEIAECDAEKERRLSEADFPVDGLGFDESGVTLDGLPFAQASTARKLRVSVALGAALNPRCKVMLVREGSSLDTAGLELLATLARETDSQVWVERVSDDGAGCSVLIEDGMVKGMDQ